MKINYSLMPLGKVNLWVAILAILLFSCHPKPSTEVEGLWMSTKETSHLFAPGAEEVALRISRDSSDALTARAYFLNKGEFKMEWGLKQLHYDDEAGIISILDADSDTLIFTLLGEANMLKGAIHLQDGTQLPLDFVRADRQLEIRLFHPRIPDARGQISYSYQVPESMADGLTTASLQRYIRDSSAMASLMKEVIDQKYGSIKSLLILKDNSLLVEEYFYGYTRDDLQQIRSCTKSVSSLMLGIALDRHKEVGLDQSIFRFFPEYTSLKVEGRERITLSHLLTMMSGYVWDDIPGEMFEADDCFEFILSRPLESKPGEKFNYNSGCSILLGGVIRSLEHTDAEAFAKDVLFDPLGITAYLWERHKDGTLHCGHGLSMRPRDMAKIGLLVLNEGRWNGQQLVSEEWIQASTQPQVRESDYFNYGYQWWHRSSSTKQWWKEPHTTSPTEHELVTALGHGGQYIMIVRDLNLVVVVTASDFNNGHLARSKIPLVVEKIIPLFEDS